MISVLVISHNGKGHLRHCLEKLDGQREEWGEVLVIDNASTDGSIQMVESDFPWCRLLALDENVGFGAANNRGAAAARGDSLLLLNSDAWLADGSLERLGQRLAGDPTLGLVAPQVYYPDGRPQFTWCPETGIAGEAIQKLRNRFEAQRFNHRQLPAVLKALTGPGWYSAACLLVRKEAFEATGGFDEGFFLYFEDVDLSRRLRLAGWKMDLAHEASAFHVKGGSQLGDRAEIAYRQGQLRYYAKHRPAWENRWLRRRMQRKFSRVLRPELRRELLGLLES